MPITNKEIEKATIAPTLANAFAPLMGMYGKTMKN